MYCDFDHLDGHIVPSPIVCCVLRLWSSRWIHHSFSDNLSYTIILIMETDVLSLLWSPILCLGSLFLRYMYYSFSDLLMYIMTELSIIEVDWYSFLRSPVYTLWWWFWSLRQTVSPFSDLLNMFQWWYEMRFEMRYEMRFEMKFEMRYEVRFEMRFEMIL